MALPSLAQQEWYDSMADQTKILKEGKVLDLSYNAIIFKPGVHQPQTGVHLVS